MSTRTLNRLRGIGFDLVTGIKRDLASQNKNATGEMSKSLSFQIININNNMGLIASANDYWTYVNDGRKAGSMPPETANFRRWLRAKGIPREASYVIRRSIGQNGIPATNIFDDNVEAIKKQIAMLIAAQRADLESRIGTTLKNASR